MPHEVFVDEGGDVLLRRADGAPREQVVFEALEFEHMVARHVFDADDAEVRQAGERAEGGEFALLGFVDHHLPRRVRVRHPVDLLLARVGRQDRDVALGIFEPDGDVCSLGGVHQCLACKSNRLP